MRKNKRTFIIPAEFIAHGAERATFETYPQAMVFGDSELAKILDVNRQTILKWKQKKIIPYKQAVNCTEYKLLDVVEALRKYGYPQNVPGNPTGPAEHQ